MLFKKLAFAEAVADLTSHSGNLRTGFTAESRSAMPPRELSGEILTTPAVVAELWRGASASSLAVFYIESRGIPCRRLPGALRGHNRVWCKEVSEYRPAMLAAITNSEGRVTSVQRIYLEAKLTFDGEVRFSKGARAADLKDPKKTLGPMGSGAVKLAAAGEILGLCEGVESALAAAALYRIPVWATCGSGRLGSIALPPPVKHVVIFGDNDEPGRAAAAKAEHAYRPRGYGCQTEFPERGDWCQMLQ